jgi:hypothetical protein
MMRRFKRNSQCSEIIVFTVASVFSLDAFLVNANANKSHNYGHGNCFKPIAY